MLKMKICRILLLIKYKQMKIFKAILLLGLIGTFGFQAQSQSLTKSEKKKLKKEIKAYKKAPETYKDMKNLNKQNIEERDEVIAALTAQLDAVNAQNAAMRDSLMALTRRYQSLMTKMQNIGSVPDGTVYAVQIGYYKKLDLEGFNSQARFIKAEEIDGAKRYVIGYFNDLAGAVQFGEDIKKIGIKDAFVSEYVDGQRNMSFDALKVK